MYVRVGGGADWPQGERFEDVDDCSTRQPAALFGCGPGYDGKAIGAAGSFRTTPVLDAAVGYRLNSWLRTEALLSWRPDMAFSGQSNFRGRVVGRNQPVSGSLASLSGFGVAYADLPRLGSLRPFLGAGLGVASNSLGAMTYRFPSISSKASTTTPGGQRTDLAYLLTAGFSVPLNPRLDLDLSYRFTDLGSVSTDSGQALIVRPARRRSITIGGTTADLRAHGVMLGLRYAF